MPTIRTDWFLRFSFILSEMRRQADAYAFSILDKVSAMLVRVGEGVEEGKDQIRQNQR